MMPRKLPFGPLRPVPSQRFLQRLRQVGLASSLCLFGSLASCGGDKAGETDAPEVSQDSQQAQDPESPAEPLALRWTTPDGWREVPPANAQRVRQYEIDVPDGAPLVVAISHWKGGVGGLTANLTRWKRSLGLGDEDPNPQIDTQTVSDMTVTLFDGEGVYTSMQGTKTEDARLLTAYIESFTRFEGVYTFRLVGPADQVAPHVERFRALALGL